MLPARSIQPKKQPAWAGGRQKGENMQQLEFIADLRDRRTYRSLKIEADGDGWVGKIKPKIRLKGDWLERAGFKAGGRVRVTCLMAGVMELRSDHLPHASNNTSLTRTP